MPLKLSYDSLDSVDEAFHSLYTEKDGKFVLTGVEGMKTQADIDRVLEAKRKEAADHAATKEKLALYGDLDPEQITKDLAELEEARIKLQAGGGKDGKLSDEDLEKLAEARVKTATAPLQRQLEKLAKERDTFAQENTTFKEKERTRAIGDAVRKAATESKVIGTALDDVIMLAERVFEVGASGEVLVKDNVGFTPGIAPDIWLNDMQEKRPHWWPASSGGGAGGGNGGGTFSKNPFSAEHWSMTEQGRILREDKGKAERMAAAAGTTIGGMKPQPKKAS